LSFVLPLIALNRLLGLLICPLMHDQG